MDGSSFSIDPLWADSLGAKTTCTFIETPEVNILIDPGIAVMHPSFPASWSKKFFWKAEGWFSIKKASRKADVILITHYHYDHFTDFDKELYDGKLLFSKNPNEFINDSQMERARNFFDNLCSSFGGIGLEDVLEEEGTKEYGDPLDKVPQARDMDLGDYNSRRKEVLDDWEKIYWKRVDNWNSSKNIPELDFEDLKVRFPEDEEYMFGDTTVRFTPPMYHGIELSKTGWVYGVVIQRNDEKFVYSSDLQGPTVEDYADWIIEENPDFLLLDGPATYLYGFMLNKTNLDRAVDNATRIVDETDTDLVIYDHHLVRDDKYKDRTEKVWKTAEEQDKDVFTLAEYRGIEPAVLG